MRDLLDNIWVLLTFDWTFVSDKPSDLFQYIKRCKVCESPLLWAELMRRTDFTASLMVAIVRGQIWTSIFSAGNVIHIMNTLHIHIRSSCLYLSLRYLFEALSSFWGGYFLKRSCASSISCSKLCGICCGSEHRKWWTALISHSQDNNSLRCDITSWNKRELLRTQWCLNYFEFVLELKVDWSNYQ